MYYQKIKKSRKEHQCFGCKNWIDKGAEYGRITAFPYEIDYMMGGGPVQAPFCLKCYGNYKGDK